MKNLIVLISVCVFLSFSFSSSVRNNDNTVMSENVFSSEKKESHFSNLLDSAEDDIPEVTSPLKDVSGMFNERGYYKSNGFSFDDQEIINDFNGNLMYSVPLYNYALGGDLNLQMKLTYNGSVGHIITTSDTDRIRNQASVYTRRNINFPEWIIDLNGFALQTFNFETNFFTAKNPGSNYVSGSSVNAIISGYHYDNELGEINIDNHDRINILSGDGSVITLENVDYSGDSTNLDNFIGNYVFKGKESYYKAIVSYLGTPSQLIAGNNPRKVILLKGDGLEYIFEEAKINFNDFRTDVSLVNGKIRPIAIYLKEIRDRFSHSIAISYSAYHPFSINNTEPLEGRQLLKQIQTSGISSTINKASFWFEYGPGICKIFHESELNGNYSIIYDTPVGYRTSDNYKNQRGTVGRIINILNQKSEFSYDTYLRRYDNLYALYYNQQAEYLNVSLNDLKRMKSSKTNLGLKRDYLEYLAPDSISVNLSTFYSEGNTRSVIGALNDYMGYGRDPFFVNMIKKKSDSLTTLKSETTYDYYYSFANRPATNPSEDVQIRPVDILDDYSTTMTLISKETETENNSVTSSKSKKFYKVYPVFNPNNAYEVSIDKNGITKLIQEDNIKPGTTDKYISTTYSYEIGSFSSSLNGYDGSFLNKNKKVYPENLTAYNEWSWTYSYQNNDPNKPVIQSTEHDPFGNYSVTDYTVFDDSIWHKQFISDFNYNSAYIKSHFYRISLPLKEKRYSPNGDSLLKKTYTYITDTGSTSGYLGQLISEKVYKYPAFSEYIETSYEYCRNDTAGKHIFSGTGLFPYKEGNIRLTKTNDKEIKYFYIPLSLSEVYKSNEAVVDEPPGMPKLRYKIKYTNGSILNTYSNIWDFRFPIRTDVYKVNGSARDTLSITYKSYTLDGSPSKMIDQNKYLTQFVYQPVHRINSITLPGDFSTQQDSLILNINHNYFQANTNLNIDGYGFYSFSKDSLFYTTNFQLLNSGCCPGILDSVKMVNEIYINRRAAFLFFDTNNVKLINNYSNFDSVKLNLSTASSNYLPHNIGFTKIQIVKAISSSNAEHTCGTCGIQGNPVKLSSRKINSYGNSELFDTLKPNTTNSFDVKNIIPSDRKVNGILILPSLSNLQSQPYPDHNFNHSFNGANIEFYGNYDNADTLKIPVIKSGTIKYYYDDVNHKVNVYSVRSSLFNERSRIQYSIDGYGNVKQKDIYTSETDSNSYKYKFNYMNLPAENLDALNQYTKFSYDGLGRLIKTKNADTSSSLNSYSYRDSLVYTFGTVKKVIEKQRFTDEEGNHFDKYFDAVGNLRREVKFLEINPNEDFPLNSLITDYKYDSLYRVTQVKTPEGKNIYYSYDGYGRQSKRITPDAGTTDYIYDKNNNLIYSQDANQRNINSFKFTFRNYDGMNRLTGIGEAMFDAEDNPPGEGIQVVPSTASSYLTVNVYDTISPSIISNFFNGVSGYTDSLNYTKGNLAATAYRTRSTDTWNFKYYRYDVRGRVIKMWNVLAGFDTLITDYFYNSQDQVTDYSHTGKEEKVSFRNSYDYAGRLSLVDKYDVPDVPNPDFLNLAQYDYNENSQVSQQLLHDGSIKNNFYYSNRNWIETMFSTNGTFEYTNTYFKNGNVKSQYLGGDYNNNFSNTSDLTFTYVYDKSNRLTEAKTSGKIYELLNTYDKDGNILTLDRSGSNGNLIDDFDYVYYSGTNKLQRVFGAGNQFTYDYNGNVISEAINNNSDIKYDHRNLITQLKHRSHIITDSTYYVSYYGYDEAGNRISKVIYRYTGTASVPDAPPNNEVDTDSNWELANSTIYSRDVSGREVAIYENDELDQYPIYGLDMIGKLYKDVPYYYFKDHLGSVRAVINPDNEVVSAQDYDMWGYLLEGRQYESGESKFKFTGKERDEKSDYDYFGARYYDARVGRWGSTDPLSNLFTSFSSYAYGYDNPLSFFDVGGAFPYTFHIRSFAPPNSFLGTGFHDDNRGFSIEQNVTSRVKQEFTIDPSAQTYSGGKPISDPTFWNGLSLTASPTGGIYQPEFSSNYFGSSSATTISNFEASNPFFLGVAPNIDVSSAIGITEDIAAGKLYLSIDLMSKQFPATESLIQDNAGNVIFLSGGAAYGSASDLGGANRSTISILDIVIGINSTGVFQNVTFQGKVYSIEEYNRFRTEKSAGPFER